MKDTYVCCICGKEFEGFGNNPYPLSTDEKARCCDTCNDYVIAARIYNIQPSDKEAIESLLSNTYDENHPIYKAIEAEDDFEEEEI